MRDMVEASRTADPELVNRIRELETKLQDIAEKFNGDPQPGRGEMSPLTRG